MRHLVTGFALAATCAVWAQSPSDFDGKWEVAWKNQRGRDLTAELNLSGGAGTYQTQSSAKSADDPCARKAYPVTVEKATADEWVFSYDGAKVMAGCPQNRLTLKKVADGRYEGQFAGGTAVTVTRK